MKLSFTASGIGSMPYIQPEAAIDLIAQSLIEIPHWPQLPKRGDQEDFVFQYLAPLVKIGLITIEEKKTPYIDSDASDFPDKLTAFYELYLNAEAGDDAALEEFAFPQDSALGFYAFCDAAKKRTISSGQVL